MEVRGTMSEEEVVEGKGPTKVLRTMSPKVPGSKGSKVQGSQGPKDQDISKSHSNTSLTLKKVHLVCFIFTNIHFLN